MKFFYQKQKTLFHILLNMRTSKTSTCFFHLKRWKPKQESSIILLAYSTFQKQLSHEPKLNSPTTYSHEKQAQRQYCLTEG